MTARRGYGVFHLNVLLGHSSKLGNCGGEVTIIVVMPRDLTDNGGRDLVNHTSGTVRGLASVALGVC